MSRLRMLDGGDRHEKIPGRLAMSLIAPFLIVAIFLWVFSKQALSPTPKTIPPDIPPAPIVDPVLPETEEKTKTPLTFPAENKKEVEKRVVETPQPPSQPVDKKSPVPPKPPVEIALKKPVDKGALASKPSPQKKKEKVATPPKKEPRRPPEKEIKKNEPEKAIPKIEPVTLKKGRPRSPLEKETSALEKKSTPPVPSPSPSVSKDSPASPPAPPASPVAPSSPLPPVPKAPQTSRGGSYTIQIGAFPKKEDAKRLAFWLKEKGYDAYIVLAEIPDKGTWHRVRIGHYPNRTIAEKEGEKISNAERLQFFITSN